MGFLFFLTVITIITIVVSAFVVPKNNIFLKENDIIIKLLSTREQQQKQEQKVSNRSLMILLSKSRKSISNSNYDANDSDSELSPRRKKRTIVRNILRRLANLSLKDYEWRSNIFKTNEADRGMEASLARMMGEEKPAYIRPMDASQKGPLGTTEEKVVTWLSDVIEEEGKRAKQIVSSEGEFIRPMENNSGGNGPLGQLEETAVSFVGSIRISEQERIKDNNLLKRPKDVDLNKRGPLGNAEAMVAEMYEKIAASELKRQEMTKEAGGKVVRPKDIDSPIIGDIEAKVFEAIEAEKERARERKENKLPRLRPMNATIPGPLGNAERNVMEKFNLIKEEEKERFKNIQQVIKKQRPMEIIDQESTLGKTEALTVRFLDRVKKLFQLKNGDNKNTNDSVEEKTKTVNTAIKLELPSSVDEEHRVKNNVKSNKTA
mmetsp:Transcript_35759/g.40769  ORF Transcript_35759/g.40769 Transcript_35759/m.40769 type:complete len:433 (-) Transcript_35759:92-1390(-)